MKKIAAIFVLALICFSFTSVSKNIKKPVSGKAWLGVTHAMGRSHKGFTEKEILAVEGFGIIHAATSGAIWGLALGGPVGFGVGVAVGF